MFSNEKTIEKEDNTEKFKAFQKRFFMLGIGFLIVASVLYVLLHSLAENPHIIIEFFIFAFAISSVTLIFIGLVMPKDTNWFSLVGSTVFLFCCLLVLIFYPDQEFQQRLNIISLVTIIGTLLFGVFDVFINAVFFPSKNPEIRQSVDFVSNRFAVEVLTFTFIIGTVFGTIAYLFFVPNKDIALFFGGIDIKNVAIATAGLVTFFWGAKTAKNRSIELEEKKQDGKRRDKEIKMAEARDTAQLIAKASELLGSENDAQKNAGLAFLNTVASQKGGPLQKEAFDLLADFILSDRDTTTSNKPRMRAINYVDDLLKKSFRSFRIDEFIEISFSDIAGALFDLNKIDALAFEKLKIRFTGFRVSYQFIDKVKHPKIRNQYSFFKCTIEGRDSVNGMTELKNVPILGSIIKCCKIFIINRALVFSSYIEVDERENKQYINKFVFCDFSDCENWEYVRLYERENINDIFYKCFYYAGHAPDGFDKKYEGALLTEITSEQQFNETLGVQCGLKYSPPDDDKKTSNE